RVSAIDTAHSAASRGETKQQPAVSAGRLEDPANLRTAKLVKGLPQKIEFGLPIRAEDEVVVAGIGVQVGRHWGSSKRRSADVKAQKGSRSDLAEWRTANFLLIP